MKKKNKIICKTNVLKVENESRHFISITPGEEYQVLDQSSDPKFRVYGSEFTTDPITFFKITDNTGLEAFYPELLFKSKSEILNEILNDLLK